MKGRMDRSGYEATVLTVIYSLEKLPFIETVQSAR